MAAIPTTSELRNLLDKAPPGPWTVEKFEEQHIGYPLSAQFYLSSEDGGYIARGEATDRYCGKMEKGFTLMALAPQLAEEVLRLRKKFQNFTSEVHLD